MRTGSPSANEARFGTLTSLGPRGEGWVGLQTVLGLLVLTLAPATGHGWSDPWSTFVGVIGIVILLGGVGLFGLGSVTLGRSFSIWVKPRPEASLHREGIYRWMRHPVCTSQVLIGIGWSLAWGSLVALALVPVYIWYLDRYKLEVEERWLTATYPDYRAYRETVRHRMLPWPPGPRPPRD